MANALDAFSADLARLADLTDDELSALESNIMTAFDTADEANDEETMTALADALDTVRSELDKRKPDAPADEPAVAAIAAPEAETETEIEAADTAVPEVPAEHSEAEAPAEAEAHAAASEEPAVDNLDNTNETKEEETTVASVDIPKDRAPQITEAAPNVITAAADIAGVPAGAAFDSLDAFADAFAKRINSLNRLNGGDGERVLVASIKSTVPEDRLLLPNDPEGNRDKIMAVTDLSVLTASGGCCAPLTTRYDLFTIGETSRPVRDSLAGFQADRGGIRFFTSPTLSDLGLATGFWDCSDDAAYDEAVPSTWKVCARIDCPTEQTALTEAVTMCLTFGVLSSRVFPENVTANTRLALVQHARLAESALLARIKAGSTAITGPAVAYGAVRDLLLTVARIVAWYRDRHRLDKDVPLRAILPLWVLEVLVSDLIVQPPAGDGRAADFAVAAADVQRFFTDRNINITWTLDGPSPTHNGGGTYGGLLPAGSGGTTTTTTTGAGTTTTTTTAAGYLPSKEVPVFPTTVQWALFAEGSWLFLDGGSLDLGVVRDSTLVRSNDYMQFSEVFESAVKIGGESLWITSPISVLGAYSKAIA